MPVESAPFSQKEVETVVRVSQVLREIWGTSVPAHLIYVIDGDVVKHATNVPLPMLREMLTKCLEHLPDTTEGLPEVDPRKRDN